jgi:hypothetical protein
MSRSQGPLSLTVALVLVAAAGCGGKLQCEVTVENKSDTPCSFFVTLGEKSNIDVKVEDIGKGDEATLLVADSDTVVQSVRVMQGDKEQTLEPKEALPVGKRCAIVVDEDGKVDISIEES